MKKLIVYGITVLISASIPIYFLLIWEPLKAKDVIGSDISYNNLNEEEEEEENTYEELSINNIEIYNKNIFNNFESIDLEKRERLNQLLSNLAIEDIIKINNYFKDLSNKEDIIRGIDLVEKRMRKEDFKEFKDIMKEYIELEENI